MQTRFIFLILVFSSAIAEGHHSVSHYYDESALTEYSMSVEEFRFVHPHPVIRVKESHSEKSKIWYLELDNLRELVELGFNEDTFRPGDDIIVNVLPSPYNPDALYVKSLEHPRLGFGYIHNVRRLFEL